MKSKLPLLIKLFLPYLLGILITYFLQLNIQLEVILVGTIILTIATLLNLKYSVGSDKFFGIVAIAFFFLLGGYITSINDSRNNQDYFGNNLKEENQVQMRLTEDLVVKPNSYKSLVEVQFIDGDPVVGKSLVYFSKSEEIRHLKNGDIIFAKCNFNEIKSAGNPYEFDYGSYLEKQDVHYQCYLKEDDFIKGGEDINYFSFWISNIRNTLGDLITQSSMTDENKMVASALLLGEKNDLDPQLRSSYATAGAMHILAVSGLHVGIVMLLLSFLLKGLKRFKNGKFIFAFFVLFGVWFYAFLTGLSPSVFRSAIMFSFIIIGSQLQRDTSVYQSILVSAFLLLLIEPFLIFNVGFQLSYSAVLGIVYFQPKIFKSIYVKNKWLDKVWQITSVSIAAQLATFPLSLYYFHLFPNYFLVANIIVIPLAFLLLFVGLTYFSTFYIPYVAEFIFFVLDQLLSFLNYVVKLIESIPYSLSNGISIHWFEVLLIYLTIVLFSVSVRFKKSKILLLSFVPVVLILAIGLYEKKEFENSNEIVFYNVKNEIGVAEFKGFSSTFYCSPGLMNNVRAKSFSVSNHWCYRLGKPECDSSIVINESDLFFEIGNHNCLFLNSHNIAKIDLNKFPVTDIIYLYSINYLPIEIIDFICSKKIKLIVGNKVGYKLKSVLNKRVSEGLVHELKVNGAHIQYFK